MEYEVPDRDGDGKGELIALVTAITDFREAPAAVLAAACHQKMGAPGLTDPGKVRH